MTTDSCDSFGFHTETRCSRTHDADEVADHVVGVAGLEVSHRGAALAVDALEEAGDGVRRPHGAHGRVEGRLQVLDERRHLCGVGAGHGQGREVAVCARMLLQALTLVSAQHEIECVHAA